MLIIDDINVDCCKCLALCVAPIHQNYNRLHIIISETKATCLFMSSTVFKDATKDPTMINYTRHQINKWLKLKSYQCFFYSQQDSVTIWNLSSLTLKICFY